MDTRLSNGASRVVIRGTSVSTVSEMFPSLGLVLFSCLISPTLSVAKSSIHIVGSADALEAQ